MFRPFYARANGMWRGPDPPELACLSYAETKAINLARVYVSVKRIFLDRGGYARTSKSETPFYHQKNVVAYPQNPDAALRTLGMSPTNLAKTLLVQFVGEDREALRWHPDLSVSVDKLRRAFAWLSVNSWPFMEATKHHELWESDCLAPPFEELLQAYTASVGNPHGGAPKELIAGASRIPLAHASVHSSGPADCVETVKDDEENQIGEDGPDMIGNQCAAALNGGLDDISPVQLWDTVMKKYKVAEMCDQELARLEAEKDESKLELKKKEKVLAVAEAVEALGKLHHKETLAKLKQFVAQNRSVDTASLVISHSTELLRSNDPLFWFSCFVRLFPRGDSAQKCLERSGPHLPAWRWAKCLLTRADFPLWRQDVEFVASLYNFFLRRDQIGAVEVYAASAPFKEGEADDLQQVTATGLVAQAMSSGDVNCIRDVLRKKNLEKPVERALRKLLIVQRSVRGSEAERDNLLPKFRALRLWSGCSSLFFTLNPHDIRSPITLTLLQGDSKFEKSFSLDQTDEELDAYVKDYLRDEPRRLNELVAQNQLAATRCFHWTVRLVIRTLFSCADKPGAHEDNIAANEVPGIFGLVRAYFGVVEPQMRKALHVHMLVQLVGFAHPQDIIGTSILPDTFRRLWFFVASICFRSTESFAHYLGEPAAMATLATKPLLYLTPKQSGMIGPHRVQESYNAQVRARGLSGRPHDRRDVSSLSYFASSTHGAREVSAANWSQQMVSRVFDATRKTGNHVCRADVCHKGRIGKKGFCRMFYWHWVRCVDERKGVASRKMTHGLQLQERWNGSGDAPIHRAPPLTGLPALEMTHPFHFKMSPAMLLGPVCNHDLGILLRLCNPRSFHGDGDVTEAIAAIAAMLEDIGDHEHYCASYSSKEQPHVEGLLLTLADALRSKEADIAAAKAAGEEIDDAEVARRILHRLVSATNRRMHKGFPEMFSYLLRKPTEYSSHKFTNLFFEYAFRKAMAIVHSLMNKGIEVPQGSDGDYLKVQTKPYLDYADYPFRALALERFPTYFFIAACELASTLGPHSMEWITLKTSTGLVRRQRSYCQEPIRHSVVRELPLLNASRQPIHRYNFYLRLIVDKAWRVPVLHGKWPRLPDDSAGAAEKGYYALFMMFLFRPHRDVADFFPGSLVTSSNQSGEAISMDNVWNAVFQEFTRWRTTEIDSIARPYLNRQESEQQRPAPSFNTPDWWACVISEKLLNYDTIMRKHSTEAAAPPTDLDLLPEFVPPKRDDTKEVEAQEKFASMFTSLQNDDDDSDESDRGEDQGTSHEPTLPTPRKLGVASPLATHCGELPAGSQLDDFHTPPLKLHPRNQEGVYWRGFAVHAREAFPASTDLHDVHGTTDESWNINTADALEAVERQNLFFKSVDEFNIEPGSIFKEVRSSKDDFDQKLDAAMKKWPQSYARSDTVVMEAAFFLLREKLLNIPDVGTINVKQARAFLWNAAWLQEYMTAQWRHERELQCEKAANKRPKFDNFCLAIMGPGGTGKTAILKVTEALTVFFAGPDTVRKLAPSNAAARLLGGDTIHALCKLPWGKATLTSKKGRLTNEKLQTHRQKWRSAIAAYIDEISMVTADQLCQCDVRLRQATMKCDSQFGNLAVNLCGDFLQLPPVTKEKKRPSLAQPFDDEGNCETEIQADETVTAPTQDAQQAAKNAQALVEARQGFELWRSVRRVVCLTINVRAPGPLSRLLVEMRAGHISDGMWNLYMSRVMTPNDPRLTDLASPFAKHTPQIIVHRHNIRVMRSLENAREESRKWRVPLYILQAKDEAVHAEDKHKLTKNVQEELLRRFNPDAAKGLPSFLPLYRGMRLLMASKDCVRFGLVKGCVCILRDIVLAEDESKPEHLPAGQPHHLTFMPVSLLLQAEGEVWTLPKAELPRNLPAHVNKRGLFQIRPTYDYLRAKFENDYFSVRRSTFLIKPADTITVYAAQGSTFDTIIVDMKKPPSMGEVTHWLACYVMLSRAKSIEGLLVLRPATRDQLSKKPPQFLLDELNRLEQIEKASLQELIDYLESLPLEVPAQIMELFAEDAVAKEANAVSLRRQGEVAPVANPQKTENGSRSGGKTSVSEIVLDTGKSGVGKDAKRKAGDRSQDPPATSKPAANVSMDGQAQVVPVINSQVSKRQRIVGKMSPSDISLKAAASQARKCARGDARSDAQGPTLESSAKRLTSAHTAEARQTAFASRGIGNADALQRFQSDQISSNDNFGASQKDKLRRQLEDSRERERASATQHGETLRPPSSANKTRLAELLPVFGTDERYAWICFMCLLQLGLMLARVENDNKDECVLCKTCPQGIYKILANSLPQAGKDLSMHQNQSAKVAAEKVVATAPEVQEVLAPRGCTRTLHVCTFKEGLLGCASCHRTCHRTCESPLCPETPCGICMSMSLQTHEHSELCIEAQTDHIGCHACGRFACASVNPNCHALCVRDKHVCESNDITGCSSCSKLCHESNADVRCSFFLRQRRDLPWEVNEQQLMDTRPETGGDNSNQVVWTFTTNTTKPNKRFVDVDGVSYYIGYGNPGRAAEGERNNCLIDSLRQCLGLTADRKKVRADLQAQFGSAVEDRAKVTDSSYLDVDFHWRAILHSLFRHNTSGLPLHCDINEYCVIALYTNNPGNGSVNGNLAAPHRLIVLNTSDIHFDPCLYARSF